MRQTYRANSYNGSLALHCCCARS